MAVIAWRELARTATHKIGESPQYIRTFISTLDDPNTDASTVVATIGCSHGSSHPELVFATVNDLEYEEAYEGNRYWSKMVATYAVPRGDNKQASLLPWQRADRWKFQSAGAAVPALYYYDDTTLKPLVNSAGDYFEGLMVDEAQQKITITANREAFPSAMAAAVTNCLNDATYLGFPADGIKVQGISGEQASETIDGAEGSYWKITSELLGRQSGWSLQIPDIGFNFVEGGVKKRAFVIGPPPDNTEVPTANAVGLNGSGAQVAGSTLPSVLVRRPYKRITMGTYFGTPPT